MSLRRIIIALAAGVVLLLGGAWYWLLYTEAGAKWVWGLAESATDDALRAREITGTFSFGLAIKELRFDNSSALVAVDEIELVIDVDLLPLSVEAEKAQIAGAVVELREGESTGDEPADPGGLLESLRLPLRLIVADLLARDINLTGLVADKDVFVDEVRLVAQWDDRIDIERLEIESPQLSANVVTALDLVSPHEFALTADVVAQPALTDLPEALAVTATASGDLNELPLSVLVRNPEVTVQGRLLNLLSGPGWDLVLESPGIAWAPGDSAEEIAFDSVRVSTAGSAEAYSLQASAGVGAAQLAPFRIEISGNGDQNSFDAEHVSANGDDGEVEGTASIDWSDEAAVAADLRVSSIDLSRWLEQWPSAHALEGRVAFRFDSDVVRIRDSRLAVSNTGMQMTVDANVDLADETVSGDLQWQGLQWPVGVSDPRIVSEDGQVSVSGTLDAWQVDGVVAVSAPGVPTGQFNIGGNGDRDSIELHRLQGDIFGGEIDGQAAYRWRNDQPWSLQAAFESVDTGTVFDAAPALLNGQVVANGTTAPLAATIRLTDVNGSLDQRLLLASGGIEFGDGSVIADELSLQHGDSHGRLNGNLFDESGLDFDISIDDVNHYLSGSTGGITAAGSASITNGIPHLQLDAASSSIAFNEITINDLNVSNRNTGSSVFSVDVSTGSVQLAGYEIDEVELRVRAERSQQRIDLSLEAEEMTSNLSVSGEIDDWEDPSTWDGQIEQLELAESSVSAAMTEPANLDISENGVVAEEVCVVGETTSRLCVDLSWTLEDDFDLQVTLASFPINLVNEVVDTRFIFDQLLDGDFSWSQRSGLEPSGHARLTMSPGNVVNVEFPNDPVQTEAGTFSFEIVEGDLLSGVVRLPIPGFGQLAGDFQVLDVANAGDSDISGRIDVDIPDISLIDAVLPLVDEASGSVRADLDISGSVVDPIVTGNAGIENGGLLFLPIGLRLDELQLQGELQEDGEIEVNGSFRAGEGYGEIVSRKQFVDLAPLGVEVRLRGDNLTLVDIPDVEAIADADVGIGYDGGKLMIDGRIAIPRARIRPSNIGIRRISESEDVVIIAGELPEAEVAENGAKLEIGGSLELELGDDVAVILDVATADVAGSATFNWSGEPIPLANGRYDINGQVQAFGQRLDISEGAIRFPNVPADEPTIRIIAVREIFGNTEVREAGVLVTGTAKRPEVETFTSPRTTEERALTLLLTGSDFDFDQGVGAVDFGTYIAPRVYISYGIGLFDQENVIRVRYDLQRGFGITATSGQRDSGIDVNYRIEN